MLTQKQTLTMRAAIRIEPQWNVNFFSCGTSTTTDPIRIEPQWNVNLNAYGVGVYPEELEQNHSGM